MTKRVRPRNWTRSARTRDNFSRKNRDKAPYISVHSPLIGGLVSYVERTFDEAAVRASYRYLHHAGFGVTEVRAIRPGHGIVGIGYFDSEDAFASACQRCNGTANVYAGIQPRPASFLELANNTMGRLRTGAQDKDIQWLTSLVIDVDPERPKHTASTDSELALAIERADAIADWIESRDFVRPVRVMSGNGVHLWFAVPPYPIVRHEYDKLRQRLRAFEARIRRKFSGDGVLIDSIYNPSRIIKVTGTVSIKGDPTEDRPHRKSKPLDDFVRREDPRLLRAVLCIPVAASIPINQPLEVPTVLDPWISTLLTIDTWLRDLFHGTGKTDADPDGHAMDKSSSGYDYSFVLELARCGVTDPSLLAAVLMKRPDGHAAKKGAAYIERTVAKALRYAAESADKRDARPSIAVTNRDMLDLAGHAWRAISSLRSNFRVYRRGGELVQIAHYTGAYRVDRIDPKSMINLLVRAARWTAADQKHVGYVFPPARLAGFLAASAPPREIPELDYVTSVPYLDDQGRIVAQPGFHESTGIFVLPRAAIDVENLPDRQTARDTLDEFVFRHFHFVDESDVAHTLALLLTPLFHQVCRHRSPLFVIEAPVTGSGKTTLVRVIASILLGKATPPELTEISQHTIASALCGLPALLWIPDADVLDQKELWRAVTSAAWLADAGAVGNRSIWLASGENPELSQQVARRSVRIRLAAPYESPWLQDHRRGARVIADCLAKRAIVLRALLGLWQSWFATGRPLAEQILGSFEDWSEIIGGVLECAGYGGFLEMTRAGGLGEADGWDDFFAVWWDNFGDKPVEISQLLVLCRQYDFLDVFGLEGGQRLQQIQFGNALHRQRNRVLDGHQLIVNASQDWRGTRYRLRSVGQEDS